MPTSERGGGGGGWGGGGVVVISLEPFKILMDLRGERGSDCSL